MTHFFQKVYYWPLKFDLNDLKYSSKVAPIFFKVNLFLKIEEKFLIQKWYVPLCSYFVYIWLVTSISATLGSTIAINAFSIKGGDTKVSTYARQTDIFFSRKLSSVFWPEDWEELLSRCCHKKEKTHLRGHIRSFCQMMTSGSLDSGLAAGIQTCSDETMKTHQNLNPIYNQEPGS